MAGDANRAVSAAERLMEEGFFIGAIRPPSVPEGTSRLRLTISAVHEPDQIHRVAGAVARALGEN
jgi:8-amino-7-oxononanoate synthase